MSKKEILSIISRYIYMLNIMLALFNAQYNGFFLLDVAQGASQALSGREKHFLLSGGSDFVLTYEDKDGDWMLVGDVPWR